MSQGMEAQQLCGSYWTHARALSRLTVALAILDKPDLEAESRNREVYARRAECREAAKGVIRELYLIAEDWGLVVSPLLDVLVRLDRELYDGACGMTETPAKEVVSRVEARAFVEAMRV